MQQSTVTLRWAGSDDDATALAAFFADNITTSYISHSELQGTRALAVGVWRPDIREIFAREIGERLRQPAGASPSDVTRAVLLAHAGADLVGLAYVTLNRSAPIPFGVVEDIVVAAGARGGGVGQRMIDRITEEARRTGCRRLFLESGESNGSAHHFFERDGFVPVSVVMMKPLDPA